MIKYLLYNIIKLKKLKKKNIVYFWKKVSRDDRGTKEIFYWTISSFNFLKYSKSRKKYNKNI